MHRMGQLDVTAGTARHSFGGSLQLDTPRPLDLKADFCADWVAVKEPKFSHHTMGI